MCGGEWLRKTLLLLLQISKESLHFVIWVQAPAEDSNPDHLGESAPIFYSVGYVTHRGQVMS